MICSVCLEGLVHIKDGDNITTGSHALITKPLMMARVSGSRRRIVPFAKFAQNIDGPLEIFDITFDNIHADAATGDIGDRSSSGKSRRKSGY